MLGIDLGTRYSIMAVVDERGTRVVKNRWGEDRTSSYVAYGDDKLYAANEAASLFYLRPDRACPDLKRRLGAQRVFVWETDSLNLQASAGPFDLLEEDAEPFRIPG